MSVDPALKTQGVSPKVPAQAIATVIVFVALLFGLDLGPEASGGLSVLVGLVAGYFSPAAPAARTL